VIWPALWVFLLRFAAVVIACMVVMAAIAGLSWCVSWFAGRALSYFNASEAFIAFGVERVRARRERREQKRRGVT